MAGAIWVVAEYRRGALSPVTYELLSAGRSLADAAGASLAAVLFGKGAKEKAKELGERGADAVLVSDHPSLENFVDELFGGLLAKGIEAEKPLAVLVPHTTQGRAWAAYAAGKAGLGLAAEAQAFEKSGEGVKATRPCYGGSQLVDVVSKGPLMATVSKGAFARAEAKAGRAHEVRDFPAAPASVPVKTRFVQHLDEEEGTKDIGQAEIVVSGGYGLGKAEGFQLIEELAKLLGGAVGASRRAVDIGWIPYRHQVGLTGRTVKPKLYVACGISGQIQHLAGMNSADTIVAINTDKDAPLMKLATYAVQGDLYELLPALIAALKKDRNGH